MKKKKNSGRPYHLSPFKKELEMTSFLYKIDFPFFLAEILIGGNVSKY